MSSDVTWNGLGLLRCGILWLILMCQVIGFIVPRRSFVGFLEKMADGSSCVDPNGIVRNHLDKWSQNCDYTVCFHGNPITNHKYYVKYSHEVITTYNINCHEIDNSTLTFPDCCPQLECDQRGYTNWTEATEPPCYDRSPTFSCSYWSSKGGCNSTNKYYNFTENFCRQYCGFC
ncbi:hypothetical protein LSH36_310g00050 [Paralvinella palmiformis]|uniref:ShKT domain-containing protein n=1 Tax=Paralvinella palmiformis TaxID=53620 RepID=A0AAD9JH12_9ANNE|nr:hypothetical protein LSH36_310g00050 [Paralvinella palmiformis]